MRWHVPLLIALLAVFVPATHVAANTAYANITITVAGWACDYPGAFTVTYISDTEVELSWVAGLAANNTMVRAAYGRIPASRTDGYLVYYGSNTTATDTALNLDDTASTIYYRAWSESATGIWEDVGATGFMEGPAMKLIAFVIICLGMMVFAWHTRKTSMLFMSVGCWAAWTAYNFGLSDGTFDYYRMFAWVGIGLIVLCLLQAISVNNANRPKPEPEVEPHIKMWQDYNRMREQTEMMRGRGIPRAAKRTR